MASASEKAGETLAVAAETPGDQPRSDETTGREGGTLARNALELPTCLIDILPTVLEYLRLPAPPAQGRSLLPWLQGAPVEDRDAFSESVHGAALRERRWKLIQYGGRPEELYYLENDAAEKRNLRADRHAKREALLGRLAAWRAEMTRSAGALPAISSEAPALDAGLREKLKAGGYLK